jgi:hypothetical protein
MGKLLANEIEEMEITPTELALASFRAFLVSLT